MRTVQFVACAAVAMAVALTARTGTAGAVRTNISNAEGDQGAGASTPTESVSQPHAHPAGAMPAEPVSAPARPMQSTAAQDTTESARADADMAEDTDASAPWYAPWRENGGTETPAEATEGQPRRRWWWPWGRGPKIGEYRRGEGKYQGERTNRWRELALHGDRERALHALVAAVDHHPVDRPPNSVLDRRNAAEALGILGDSRAIGPLEDALNDPDFLVRQNAALSLAVLRGAR